jgi:asparagine synthase (glutamine-hydrolysing)
LSVIDLVNGRQPISNEDNTIWIVHNGEVYNYKELRLELEGKGHVFRTQTDSEVIVHLYEEVGSCCVEKLRGMFAFALWDENERQLLLARDHLGQKPLFYSHNGNELIFASEVKAILAVWRGTPGIDYTSLCHYLSLRFIPAPGTMLENIKKLPPAHVLTHHNGSLRIFRYWRLSFRNKLDQSDTDLVEGLREKLRETVARHLVADVPVGAFLSGGLDSSIIVAMMSKSLGKGFPTFSVGVEDAQFNELPYAREVSTCFGTHQFETYAKSNLIELLPRMIWYLDEPSDPVAASKYLASQLASNEVKVVLGGDGGDELFAGFDRYFGVSSVRYYARIPGFLRRAVVGPVINRIPASFGYDSIAQKLRWVHQVSMLSGVAERFAEAVAFFRFNHDAKRALLGEHIWRHVGDVDTSRLLVAEFADAEADNSIERMVYADYMMRLPEHSLMLTDRLSMAHGLEVRSPLVDRELVDYVATFPACLKIRGRQRKYVQRKVAEGELPSTIARRKKRGFRFPLASWFGNELQPLLRDFLLHSHFVGDGTFRRESVERLLEEHRKRQVDHHVRLWMLLNLEIWHRLVVQRCRADEVSDRMRSCL